MKFYLKYVFSGPRIAARIQAKIKELDHKIEILHKEQARANFHVNMAWYNEVSKLILEYEEIRASMKDILKS